MSYLTDDTRHTVVVLKLDDLSSFEKISGFLLFVTGTDLETGDRVTFAGQPRELNEISRSLLWTGRFEEWVMVPDYAIQCVEPA